MTITLTSNSQNTELSDHERAQRWGIEFVRRFLQSEKDWPSATPCDIISPRDRQHLAHCYENADCLLIRDLVFAVNQYTGTEYWYYRKSQLARIGIFQEMKENHPFTVR